MFYALGLVFDGTEGVRSHFHVLRSRTCFRWCRVRRVTFSCFARPNSFSTVSRAIGVIFMFCATKLIFDGTEGVGSRFHSLLSWKRFWRSQGQRVLFSCFTRPDSFSTVPSASGPVFMFCAPDSFLKEPRASAPVYMFCALGLVFGGTEGVGSHFHVLSARTHFWRYRMRPILFSCLRSQACLQRCRVCRFTFSYFTRSDSFSMVPRAISPFSCFARRG
jgi:hypothetical protein